MRILVFGANGMAGHMAGTYLREAGHEIIGYSRTPCECCSQWVQGDVLDQRHIRQVLKENKFDAVVNAVGVLNTKVDEDLWEGIYINSAFPHLVAECLKGSEARLIHISTDCVFSGKEGKYAETSQPDADTYYGRSKALGEVKDDKNLTLRTSIIGPELKADGVGLLHWFLNQAGTVSGYQRVIWSGVTTLELAKAIEAAINQNISGLYHLVNNRWIAKYELLKLFNKHMRGGQVEIRPDGRVISDKSLINTRTDFQYTVPGYEEMIEELAGWMKQHKGLYPLYQAGR